MTLSQAQKLLFEKLYAGCSMKEMIDLCEIIMGTPVRFSPSGAPERSLTSAHFNPIDLDDLLRHVYPEGRGLAPQYVLFMSRDYPNRGNPRPFRIDHADYHHPRKLCWVTVGEHCYGHLSVPEGAIPLEEIDDELLVQCSRCFGLCCQAHQQLHEVTSGDELLGGLLEGRITTQPQLLSSSVGALLLGDPHFRLLCFRVQAGVSEQILPHLHTDLRGLLPHAWYAFGDSGLTALINDDREPFTAGHRERLCAFLASLHCCAIVSDRFSSLLGVKTLKAQMTGVPAFLSAPEGTLVDYALHKEYGLLASSSLPPEELQRLCNSAWLAMLDYDRHGGSAYVHTLQAYLKCACSVARTAEQLFVHHNTVLYRLTRIQELFGLDLGDGDVLFSLALSIRILDYLHHAAQGFAGTDRSF